jgi:hypothetical protein
MKIIVILISSVLGFAAFGQSAAPAQYSCQFTVIRKVIDVGTQKVITSKVYKSVKTLVVGDTVSFDDAVIPELPMVIPASLHLSEDPVTHEMADLYKGIYREGDLVRGFNFVIGDISKTSNQVSLLVPRNQQAIGYSKTVRDVTETLPSQQVEDYVEANIDCIAGSVPAH